MVLQVLMFSELTWNKSPKGMINRKKKFRYRIVYWHQSFINKGHECYSCYGFGLRKHHVVIINSCRNLIFYIFQTKGLLIYNIASLGNKSGYTVQLIVVDEWLKQRIDAFSFFCIDAWWWRIGYRVKILRSNCFLCWALPGCNNTVESICRILFARLDAFLPSPNMTIWIRS